ncbi:EAL domain-containing protein [Lactobacillus sp. 23-2]|uniref:EAL domain-containing protein n=1 Tax=Lactobacillus sp. 23-2 TaxID=2981842 RepID=UPI003836641D
MQSFEITERDLHALGFKFWMDDFGSGYSSLNGLYEYDFDLIKIDMKFVQHLDDNNGANRKLMRSLVTVAKEMDILSLTEGVETEEQYAFVKQIGCDKPQGFLLAKPRPMDDFGRIL